MYSLILNSSTDRNKTVDKSFSFLVVLAQSIILEHSVDRNGFVLVRYVQTKTFDLPLQIECMYLFGRAGEGCSTSYFLI